MNAAGDAIRAYDEALRALDRLEPAAERQRLQMEALWKKATAVELPRGSRAAVKLYDQSLAVAEELGDRKTQADKLMFLGTWRKRRQGGAECDRRALQLYQELGNARGQGETLLLMSSRSLCEGDTVTARAYCEQALPFLEAAEDGIWAAWCRAQLNLLTEVGEEQFPRLTTWRALCDGLEQRGGAVSSLFQRGVRSVAPLSPARPEVPDALLLYGVFAQLGDVKPFLDASAAVGGSWSSDAFSYSYQPLRATVTIQSASERVMVPAGTFDNCLLTEQVTIEGDRPDKAGKRSRQLNREYQCGTRRAWYAPGVGLVQLHVQTTGGKEALIRLQEYTVDDAGDGYLPLSMGNCWSYCWGNMPEEYVTKEAYRVAEREGELWYLEHFGYAFKA